MKCPKCGYLGFDTGDRCRHCGYDFSFAADAHDEEAGPGLVLDVPSEPHDAADRWYDQIDRALEDRGAGVGSSDDRVARAEQDGREAAVEELPLFGFEASDDDAPIVPFPASPRAPLSVRRTPDHPRLRQVPPRTPRRRPEEPALEFDEEPASRPAGDPALHRTAARPAPVVVPSSPARRLTAAAIDLVILLGIDLAVVYFTLRMSALATADWRLLPPAPLGAFLLLVKIAYFSSFTAVGGQTIGKMAVGIRVVADDGEWIDGSRAVWRTVVGTLAALVVGLGFLPALVGADRRALHDRAARTRVVSLRSV